MSTPILRLENVSNAKAGKIILRNISAEVFPGESILLRGPSGSGKTTLLRIISRFEDPTGGTVYYQQKSIQEWSPHQLRREVALVFQTPVFFKGTVLENLQLIDRMNHRSAHSLENYAQIINQVGLDGNLLLQEAASLSLGEKLRLSVARALLNKPQILLLDEPLSALDIDSAKSLLHYLLELIRSEGITILMATHQEPALIIGTTIWRMSSGELTTEVMSS